MLVCFYLKWIFFMMTVSEGIALVGGVTLLCQSLAYWLRLPAILFLLLSGVIVGPILGVFSPEALFGQVLHPIIGMAVGIILFEGSLTLEFDQIAGHGHVVRNLLTIGVLITWVLVAIISHALGLLSWPIAILFGAIMVVTGPTVVGPMVQTIHLKDRLAQILKWEGIVIDPIGALLALLTFTIINSFQMNHALDIVGRFTSFIVLGFLLGLLCAWLWGKILKTILPQYLHNIGTLMVVIMLYAACARLGEGIALLAVSVMGIGLANTRNLAMDEILNFKASISILLISGLFILIASEIQFDHLFEILPHAIILFLAIQFIVRPLVVMLSSIGAHLTWKEKLMLSWICPRGVVAAAVAAAFAGFLSEKRWPDASLLVPLVFLIIVLTVLFQSLTAGLVAKCLRLVEKAPTGVLIIGANQVARTLGAMIDQLGFSVILTDHSWDNIRQARMLGLNVYYGDPTSEHADRHLDLQEIGLVLALSPERHINLMAILHFGHVFDQAKVLMMASSEQKSHHKDRVSKRHRNRLLFNHRIHFSSFLEALESGGKIQQFEIKSEADWSKTLLDQPDLKPLFIRTKQHQLIGFRQDKLEPQIGETVVCLMPGNSTNSS